MSAQLISAVSPSRRYSSCSSSSSSTRTHRHRHHHLHSAPPSSSSSSIGGETSGGVSSSCWYPKQAHSLAVIAPERITLTPASSSSYHLYRHHHHPPTMTTAPAPPPTTTSTATPSYNTHRETTMRPLPPPPSSLNNPAIYRQQYHRACHPAPPHQHRGSQQHSYHPRYQHRNQNHSYDAPSKRIDHCQQPPRPQQRTQHQQHHSASSVGNDNVCRPSYYAATATPATGATTAPIVATSNDDHRAANGRCHQSSHKEPTPVLRRLQTVPQQQEEEGQLPLPPVLQSPSNVRPTVTDEKKANDTVAGSATAMTVVSTTGSCGSTASTSTGTASSSSSSVSSNPETTTIKTPITLCFERMLGAADLIASAPRESSKATTNNGEDDEGAVVLFNSNSDDDDDDKKPRAKRKLSMTSMGDGEDDSNKTMIMTTTLSSSNNNNAPVSMLPLKKRKGKAMSAAQPTTAAQAHPLHHRKKPQQRQLLQVTPSANTVAATATAAGGQLLEVSPVAGSVDDRVQQGSNNSNPFREIELDANLYRKVVLKMALQRQATSNKSSSNSGGNNGQHLDGSTPSEVTTTNTTAAATIPDGFFWRDYPTCEQVLYDNMADYYDVSSGKRQSKMQHAFNNKLVQTIRETAAAAGLKFDSTFNNKKLRDRIRCFYKTHLQNAKKRLVTLQKHPEWDEHQVALRVYIRAVREGISVDEAKNREPQLVLKKKINNKHNQQQRQKRNNDGSEERRNFSVNKQQKVGVTAASAERLPATLHEKTYVVTNNNHRASTSINYSSILSDLDNSANHHQDTHGGLLLQHNDEQFGVGPTS